MGANLLPWNAAVRLQDTTTEEKVESYGKDNRVLHTEHLPEKGGLDPARRTRESHRVLPGSKEVGLSFIHVPELESELC
jgi:hypothetical protein